MSTQRRLTAVALVAAVVLAGCSAGIDGSAAGGADQPGTDVSTSTETGTLDFYVSDQPTAIGDFERLAVTVTEVGVHRAGAGDDPDDEGDESPPTATTESNSTTADGNSTNSTTTTNATTTRTATPDSTASPEAGNESDGDAGWISHAVDDATVDLTELQGDNATKIANVSLPAGEYNGVYVAVSNVTGVLTTGETVDVKLPSGRLRLHEGFALGANDTTSFVFDIAVHETGNGRYVLRPVVGQSGPDVPIREVDARGPGNDVQTRGNGSPSAAAENRGNDSQSTDDRGPGHGDSSADGQNSGTGGPPEDAGNPASGGQSAGNESAAGRQAGNSSAP